MEFRSYVLLIGVGFGLGFAGVGMFGIGLIAGFMFWVFWLENLESPKFLG